MLYFIKVLSVYIIDNNIYIVIHAQFYAIYESYRNKINFFFFICDMKKIIANCPWGPINEIINYLLFNFIFW